MVKLAASARLPLSDPRRTALDVSWSFSLPRLPGSDQLAARMAQAALGTIAAHPAPCEQIARAVGLACRYVLLNGLARRYRVTIGVDDARCAVSVTDYGYDQPAATGLPGTAGPPAPPPSYETTRLCQELSGQGVDGAKMDGVQVHHALDGAVLVRFRTQLPTPPGALESPPGTPGTSRSPDARG